VTVANTGVFGRKALLGASLALVCGGAVAQPTQPGSFSPGPGQVMQSPNGYTPSLGYTSGSQAAQLREALAAARRGDVDRAQSLQGGLDPIARRLVTWAIID
jgi:hypothetical protein